MYEYVIFKIFNIQNSLNFQRLRHENLISLIEVFRRRRKLFLVFEYVERTVLEELEDSPKGLVSEKNRRTMTTVIMMILLLMTMTIIIMMIITL